MPHVLRRWVKDLKMFVYYQGQSTLDKNPVWIRYLSLAKRFPGYLEACRFYQTYLTQYNCEILQESVAESEKEQ